MKKEEAIRIIEKESDPKKKGMLYSAYINNAAYGREKELNKIVEAMAKVDRKHFVLEEDKESPYDDIPLHIGHSQTISQPSTVARMLLLSGVRKGMGILEIGSGSGWNASLLAFLAYPGKVVSIERIKPLSKFAKENLAAFRRLEGFKNLNVRFVHGSALDKKGCIWKRRYDLIMTTAAASFELIEKLMKMASLLNEGGKIIFPTQRGSLEVWKMQKGKLKIEHKEEGYAFVPLIE